MIESDKGSKNLKRITMYVGVLLMTLSGLVPIQSAQAVGTNLVNNPSVETASGNSVNSWSNIKTGNISASFSVKHPGQDGNNALYVQVSNYRNGEAKWASAAVTVKPSTAYDLSDYYKSNTTSFVVIDITTTSNTHTSISLANAGTSSADYTPYSASFTTPANAKTVSVRHGLRANGWLYTDAYSLSEKAVTPPPPPTPMPPTTVTGVCNNSQTPGIYVSPSGSDTAAGSITSPVKTISKAVTKVTPGQNIYARTGTYTEGVINVTKVGSASSWTGICAYPGEKPVLKASDYWNLFIVSGSAYVEFNGLEVQGTALTIHNYETNAFEVRTSNNVRFYNMSIHDFAGAGIGALESSDHMDVRGNYIYGNAHWSTYGQSGITFLQLKAQAGPTITDIYNNVIAGNVLWDNDQRVASSGIGSTDITDGNCIILDSMDDVPYTGRTLIKNNICAHNGARGIHIFESSHVDVSNNTLYHDGTGSTMAGAAEMDAIEAWGPSQVSDVTYNGNVACAAAGRSVFQQYQVPTAIPTGNVLSGPDAANYASTNSVVTNCTDVITNPQDAPLAGNWSATAAFAGKGSAWPISGSSL
jgi:parallel beta-helix repeat protein